MKLFESFVSKDHAAAQEALYLRKEDVVREVNGFFGFAVSSCLKKMKKKERFAEFDEDTTNKLRYENCTYFLDNMRILHRDALIDDEYMEKYYASSTAMLNHGGLTLISKNYFKFGSLLMTEVARHCSDETFANRRNNIYDRAIDLLSSNDELKGCFNKCEQETSIPDFIQEKISLVSDCDKKSIYLDLLKKALRSRMNLAFKQYREKYVGRYAEMESS